MLSASMALQLQVFAIQQ